MHSIFIELRQLREGIDVIWVHLLQEVYYQPLRLIGLTGTLLKECQSKCRDLILRSQSVCLSEPLQGLIVIGLGAVGAAQVAVRLMMLGCKCLCQVELADSIGNATLSHERHGIL